MNSMKLPGIEDVYKAAEKIRPYIHRTPVLTCKSLNNMFNAEIFFKCENFQKVGAFKFRGASNAVWSLSDETAEKGVATHSSGNHAQALALAARMRGIKATIIMPLNSPKVKKNAVAGYDGNIIFCKPTLVARETTLAAEIGRTGATEIHPYNNFLIISGQGTAALELIEDEKDFDFIITPVGGGGLLSGTLTTVSAISPKTKVIASEPEGADDACRSLIEDRIVPSVNPKTISDGLLTSLGSMTFPIIKKHVHRIVTVSDSATVQAMRLILERMKIIVEPSSATALAILLENKIDLKYSRIGIILSGGNVDLESLPWRN